MFFRDFKVFQKKKIVGFFYWYLHIGRKRSHTSRPQPGSTARGMFEDVSEYVKLRDCLADGTHALHFSQLAAAPPYDPVNEAFLTFPTSIWRSSSGQTDEEARTWKPPKLEGKRATLSEMRQLSARCRSQEPPSSSFLLASADKGVAATTE